MGTLLRPFSVKYILAVTRRWKASMPSDQFSPKMVEKASRLVEEQKPSRECPAGAMSQIEQSLQRLETFLVSAIRPLRRRVKMLEEARHLLDCPPKPWSRPRLELENHSAPSV